MRHTIRMSVIGAGLLLVTAGFLGYAGQGSTPAGPDRGGGPVQIDLAQRHQTIVGFGCSSGWTSPTMDDALADAFFTVDKGIGLSLLRVRIAPDGTSLELATARQARARGASVWAAPWSPPAEWKDNHNVNGGGHLLPEHRQDWADRLASFAKNAAAEGVPLMGLSAQNEPSYVPEPPNSWETCDYTPESLTEFVRDYLGPTLAKQGMTVPIIAPETGGWDKFDSFTNALLADPAAAAYVGSLATHSYSGTAHQLGSVQRSGRQVWQTEYTDLRDTQDTGMGSAFTIAAHLHADLVQGNVSAWHHWQFVGAPPYPYSGLTDGKNLTRRAWVIGNWSRFVRPGFVRVEATASPQPGISASAFSDPATSRLVIVLVNTRDLDLRQAVSIANGKLPTAFAVWTTSDTRALEPSGRLAVSADGTFTTTLPARSVTTLVSDLPGAVEPQESGGTACSIPDRNTCGVPRMANVCIFLTALASAQDSKMAFWRTQRKGANMHTSKPRPGHWQAAGELGLDFVRLIPDELPAQQRDFLIGSADDYRGLVEADLQLLIGELDTAERNGVKVVLVMFGLPGARYSQLNGDKDDGRLWRDERFQSQAIAFWRDLARHLKGHPAVVAYNPLNEPHPDKEYGFELGDVGFDAWYRSIRGTVADLNRFNRRVVAAIREVDPDTPILLDGWFYAGAKGFPYLEPVADDRVLYAFHNPGAWQMCHAQPNQGRYSYPDRVPTTWNGRGEKWDRHRLALEFAEVERWAAQNHIPAGRVIASELLYERWIPGAQQYLTDLISLYNQRGWHWAFYAFRPDGGWTGLDYEMGTSTEVPPGYWEAIENGADPETLKHRVDSPLWQVLAREFPGSKAPWHEICDSIPQHPEGLRPK